MTSMVLPVPKGTTRGTANRRWSTTGSTGSTRVVPIARDTDRGICSAHGVHLYLPVIIIKYHSSIYIKDFSIFRIGVLPVQGTTRSYQGKCKQHPAYQGECSVLPEYYPSYKNCARNDGYLSARLRYGSEESDDEQ
jgi:hypothetical protein